MNKEKVSSWKVGCRSSSGEIELFFRDIVFFEKLYL